MKSINTALRNYQPIKHFTDNHNPLIEGLLRRGSVTLLQMPCLAEEMMCQDCGGREGHNWWDVGRRIWFCGNQTCLLTDSAITKEREEKNKCREYLRRAKIAEKQKASKEWNGE